MTLHSFLYTLSSLIIFCVCIWANFSKKIDDGIIGKVIIGFIALSSLSIFSKTVLGYDATKVSELTFIISISAYCARTFILVFFFGKTIKNFYYHPTNCRRKKK